MGSVIDQSFDIILSKLFRRIKSSSVEYSPFIVGISGVQGSGKSTLAKKLQLKLSAPPHNYSVAYFSLDDFYLTYKEQNALRESFFDNLLYEFRGNSGTHDLVLLKSILEKFSLNKGSVSLPVYDKTAFQGAGDRLPEHLWNNISLPIDVLLIEGWMVGFQPLSSLDLKRIFFQSEEEDKDLINELGSDYQKPAFREHLESHLTQLNENLKKYTFIWDKLELLIQLSPQKLNYVFEWRWEQELAQSKTGLTQSQIQKFVNRFMPSYELFLPHFKLSHCPHHLITLDSKRVIIDQKQIF